MKNILEKCKTTRILALIGIIGLILGTIMPYVRYSFFGYTYTITLWRYWEGVVVLVIAIATLLLIFNDFVEKYIPGLFNTGIGKAIKKFNNPKYSLITTAAAAILAIYLTSTLGVELFKYYNIGFYALWIGVICLVAYAIINKGTETPANTNVDNNASNLEITENTENNDNTTNL